MLEVVNLSFKSLLKNVSLQFFPGNIYAILGPNGAGKTTFLKSVAEIWTPTSGKVLWKGNALADMPRQEISKLITFVAEQHHVPFEFSVEQFVNMGRYAHGFLGDMDPIFEQTDLQNLRKKGIHQISQGERQRAFIARALATEAPIMLFDEPTSHLDARHHKATWQLLQNLASQGKTLLVANHDLLTSPKYCSNAVVFHEGKCIAKGKYQETVTPSLLQEVFGI